MKLIIIYINYAKKLIVYLKNVNVFINTEIL